MLPSRNNWKSFILLCFPGILPIAILISMLLAPIGGGIIFFVLLQVYSFPPAILSGIIFGEGIPRGGSTESLLFQGYIGIMPTLPLGLIYCTIFWSVIGYGFWRFYIKGQINISN